MTVVCYPSRSKRKALKVCTAFAQGAGGGVAPLGHQRLVGAAPAFFYGMTDHTLPLIELCRRRGHDWFYCDNAYYFGRGTHFRVTRNALMHDGRGRARRDRLQELGVVLKPWRRRGRHIVLTTQSDLFCRFQLGISRDAWTAEVAAEIARHTDRKVVVCDKPRQLAPGQAHHEGFEAYLEDAWALVTHSSSTAVKALAEGVPVISLGASMANRMARSSLADIEEPLYPDDRAEWLNVLLANQWTPEEMRKGRAWAALNGLRR
jgi:hypothetical protein